jgi:hypothetical protein
MLKTALDKADDADVKLRLIVTISRADPGRSDEVRLVRAIETLERLGSAEAVKLLEALAKGTRGAAAAGEARATLTRLRQRRTAP